ncbi:IS1595 family transposase, partial [Capnocytophaga canis]
FSYRINRSQSKDNIFNNLIKRMIEKKPVHHRNLICS